MKPTHLLILFLLSMTLAGCRERKMIITTSKSGVSVEMIMPFDRKFKRSLKDSTDIKVRVTRKYK